MCIYSPWEKLVFKLIGPCELCPDYRSQLNRLQRPFTRLDIYGSILKEVTFSYPINLNLKILIFENLWNSPQA
jgi:hypothetical protein